MFLSILQNTNSKIRINRRLKDKNCLEGWGGGVIAILELLSI